MNTSTEIPEQLNELETEADKLRKNLTANQLIFCTEYLKDRNATQAYLRAYPNCKSENAVQNYLAVCLGCHELFHPELPKRIIKYLKMLSMLIEPRLTNILTTTG